MNGRGTRQWQNGRGRGAGGRGVGGCLVRGREGLKGDWRGGAEGVKG